MTAKKKIPKLDEETWVHSALRLLAKSNIEGVSIDVLARNFGVTKGSFYHHFQNRGELLKKMLDMWMANTTFGIITRINTSSRDPKQRLLDLLELPSRTAPEKLGWETELAIRSWARRDALALQTIIDVDRVRFDYTKRLFLDLEFAEEEATVRANMALAYLLGESLLSTSIHSTDVRKASARNLWQKLVTI
ncbi:TetR/AcrR family transcriptional regulator [Kordiimonas pumila]|uniref:TetR/AcrR family transcriptional regulator n=1 Tax=Kordiimonas pumila TaxID=2161677 RepID=A0ABV7D0I7_9PROT|nr:TetR/AcrR family transcriptional regulator [Kordiimonas pumila]